MYLLGEPVSLFNGVDLTGWTNLDGTGVPKGWVVEDGEIRHKERGGDLYTEGEYDSFILEFEFKVEKGGNSGIKYKTWHANNWGMGCEYQVADDNDISEKHRTSALYDMYAPDAPKELFKSDDYNQGKIVVMGNYIEHWLNGVRTVSAMIDSADWQARYKESKFAEEPNFGHLQKTRLFIQDHETDIHFRNITITPLTPVCGWF